MSKSLPKSLSPGIFHALNVLSDSSFISQFTWNGTWHTITNFVRVNDECIITILFNLNICSS